MGGGGGGVGVTTRTDECLTGNCVISQMSVYLLRIVKAVMKKKTTVKLTGQGH